MPNRIQLRRTEGWRFWLGGLGTACPEGRAKTEQAAKNALLAQGMDRLQRALREQEESAA
jgi:hypothetical protein